MFCFDELEETKDVRMDWEGAIRRYRGIVLVLLAALPVLTEHAPGPVRRVMRNLALSMLRPLESCTRVLAFVMLCTTMRSRMGKPLPNRRASGDKAGGLSSGSRMGPGFVLFAAGERLDVLRPVRRGGGCRDEDRGSSVPVVDDGALGRRVAALRAALADLPAQARRLAVALARSGRLPEASRRRVVFEAAARWLRNLVAGPAAVRSLPP